MSLTVTEKNHWKERIAKRIERAVEDLLAKHDPTFHTKTELQARQKAVDSLGIADQYRRIDEIKAEIKTLEAERSHLAEKIDRTLIPSTEHCRGWYDTAARIERIIKDRQSVYEKELLGETPLGLKVLRLRREQEDLLDTVWLATSPIQIRQLWNQVGQLLGQEMTELQTGVVNNDAERGTES